jgi:hypothetical protein
MTLVSPQSAWPIVAPPQPSRPSIRAELPECRLQRLEKDLASLSARLDAALGDPAFGDGLTAMGLEQASQAIHLALVEVRDSIRSSSTPPCVPVAS